ncbi:F-box protein At3g07870-like [Papaver somniferum]|uniref:F-box protein At3g07870-like n=1 Tax=Papaver somniferum TaxID=3469 RepID=UPI000E6FB325|nr:F-box protein At3g07870-like [Papaver somniferum]
MVGSCNGLVCFKISDKNTRVQDPIYICNPVTREYVYLPKYIHGGDRDSRYRGFFICGFGYNYSTHEYKVVRIYYRSGMSLDVSKVQVYTLGSGQGWRDKGNITHLLSPITSCVCANGALYWSGYGKIMAFDLADEEFRVIPLPPVSEEVSGAVCLRLLRGYVSVVHFIEGDEPTSIHVWVLKKKKKYTSSETREPVFDDLWYWNEEFSFSCGTRDDIYLPFAVTKSN